MLTLEVFVREFSAVNRLSSSAVPLCIVSSLRGPVLGEEGGERGKREAEGEKEKEEAEPDVRAQKIRGKG
jgi:hypothetical protein